MVGEVNKSFEEIKKCICKNKNFCLDAGAGAGKTYTLIETIRHIQVEYPEEKIVCITFTNNAKDEIISRLNNMDNIFVSTIHDFIWKNISKFQSVLRTKVDGLIDEKITKYKEEGNAEKVEKYENANRSLEIVYRDYESLYNGIISHDTLLDFFVSFLDNSNYCNLLFSSINFVFIDEYQDTNKKIFDKFCLKLIEYQMKNKKILLGLFGDFMQNIYNEGVGSVSDTLKMSFVFIQKVENFRSCNRIIKTNNCLRSDLKQTCMKKDIINGQIKFIYNYSDDIYLNKDTKYNDYKRLHLTHKVISKEIGFESVFSVYNNKYGRNTSDILKNANERFLRYICNEIMPNIYSYKSGIHNDLIKNINLNFFNFEILEIINEGLEKNITNMDGYTIYDFLYKLFELNIFTESTFIAICQSYIASEDEEFLSQLTKIPAIEFYNYYLQFSNKTMLETMHGTKGNEFENVIININEDSPWNWYNFTKFIKQDGTLKDSVKERTHKLLYVSCTRAKQSLIINYIVENESSKNESSAKLLSEKIKNIWNNELEFEILK